MLEDDGMFYMQVAGLRKGSNWQDTQWGLFMSRYIFPGADASTPLYWYINQLERAGFEVHSVETVGRHYSHTLKAWYDNFQKNKSKPEIQQYPARLHRLWDIFLAWSTVPRRLLYPYPYPYPYPYSYPYPYPLTLPSPSPSPSP